ncbi:MAG: amidase family protein [Acidimicrobiales bacterium]
MSTGQQEQAQEQESTGPHARSDAHELCDLTARRQLDLMRSGALSARELLDAHLTRVAALNPEFNAVVALDPEQAMTIAAAVDRRRAAGEDPGPLGGLVTAHKDLQATARFPTSYGSAVYAEHRPTADSLLVARMAAAGAVAIGKTNTPEFGAGSHTFNTVHGLTRNPYDPTRSAGGSSGGAAVALRCGMVSVADGSDAGGSLRNPAAWNNIVGFRPSPRVVPRVGPGNAWNTIPIDGPMGRTVDDVVLLLDVLARPDDRDPLNRPLDLPPRLDPVGGPLRVAFSPTLGGLPVEDDVADAVSRFVGEVEALGWEVTLDEPEMSGADESFVTLRASMYASGFAAALGPDGLGRVKATVRDEIERGLALSAGDLTDALAAANVLWRRGAEFFTRYDLLIAPVTQMSPFPAEQEHPETVGGQPVRTYIDWMRSNCRISSFGLPALSLPAGFTAAGMPVGAQLVGGPWGDVALLRAALTLEAATGHGARRPERLEA